MIYYCFTLIRVCFAELLGKYSDLWLPDSLAVQARCPIKIGGVL